MEPKDQAQSTHKTPDDCYTKCHHVLSSKLVTNDWRLPGRLLVAIGPWAESVSVSNKGSAGSLFVPGINCLAIQLHQLVPDTDVSLVCWATLSDKGHTGSLRVAGVRQHLEAQAKNLPICRIC